MLQIEVVMGSGWHVGKGETDLKFESIRPNPAGGCQAWQLDSDYAR
jgi:hypothetical protein